MGLFVKNRQATEHRYAGERLSAYLDGELSSREQGRVDRHLATCPRCRWELDTLRRTVQWAMELPAVAVPRAFTIRVPAEPVRVARRSWALPALQGATALVAVLFFVALAGQALYPRFLPASVPHAPAATLAAEALPEPTQAALAVEALAVEVTVEVEQIIAEAASAATAAPAGMGVAPTVVVEETYAAAPAPEAAPDEPQPGAEAPGIGGGEGVAAAKAAPTATAEGQARVAISAQVTATVPPPAAAEVATMALEVQAATAVPAPTAQPTLPAAPELPQDVAETVVVEASADEVPGAGLLDAPTATLSAPAPVAAQPGAAGERQAAAPRAYEPAAAAPDDRDANEMATTGRTQVMGWLSSAVLALGVCFVLLGTITIVLMIRWLRSS
jgi:hypothetical protein